MIGDALCLKRPDLMMSNIAAYRRHDGGGAFFIHDDIGCVLILAALSSVVCVIANDAVVWLTRAYVDRLRAGAYDVTLDSAWYD